MTNRFNTFKAKLISAPKNNLLRCLCGLIVLSMVFPIHSSASRPSEYDIKAVYLYNFTKFISWPESAFLNASSPIMICVYGSNPAKKTLEKLSEKITRGRPLKVNFLENEDDADTCHILFLSQTNANRALPFLKETFGKPVLTVGEYLGFVESGIIEFKVDDDYRVKLAINLNHAKQNNISISAQLLEIAYIVKTEEAP